MKKIWSFFKTIRDTFFKRSSQVVYCDDLPEKTQAHTFYIVGLKKFPWLLAFECPCGCGELIQLNLLRESRPQWSIKLNKSKSITVYPSVWRKVGCKSHFWIQESKIKWA
ncbi:DUF6527 family protein [Runella defluvii]|uniref:DUF6527 family protein n=1 Tax=Runella defluvii TaxID=370973 RepID=UPI00161A711E